MRKLIWVGILTPIMVLCFMNAACGGYIGWAGKSTSGGDAKVTEELSVFSANPLESGLWTYYVSYNDIKGPGMQTVSTYRDGTAPFGVFTSDGLLEQHFNDHVGVLAATAYDKNGDGTICWQGCGFGNDYTIPDAFCPAVGGTGSTSASNGFSAYCNKANWETIVATSEFEETKSSAPGSKFSNAAGGGTNFGPVTLGQILASSSPIPGGVAVTINGVSLPNGASTSVAPVTINAYGLGHALAVDVSQPGLKQAASWLASQWAGQPDGTTPVSLSVNGGAASITFNLASGNSAAIALQAYAAE